MQVIEQRPFAQSDAARGPEGQRLLQAPQCSDEVSVSAQVRPHTVKVDGQSDTQRLPTQSSLIAQVTPQPPQLEGLSAVGVSQPSAGSPLQSPQPGRHEVATHAPASQPATAWATAQV